MTLQKTKLPPTQKKDLPKGYWGDWDSAPTKPLKIILGSGAAAPGVVKKSPADYSKEAGTKAKALKHIEKKPNFGNEHGPSVKMAFFADAFHSPAAIEEKSDKSYHKAVNASHETAGAIKSAEVAEQQKLLKGPAEKFKAAKTKKDKADVEVGAWADAKKSAETNYNEKLRAHIKAKVKASHDPSYQKLEEKSALDLVTAKDRVNETQSKYSAAVGKQKKLDEQYAVAEAELAAKSPRITSIEFDGEDKTKGNFSIKTAKGEKKYSKAKYGDKIERVGDFNFIALGNGKYDTYYNPETGKAPMTFKGGKIPGIPDSPG